MLLPQSLYGVQYTRRTIHSKSKLILGGELFLNARHNSVEESCLTFKRIATKTGEILEAVLLVGELIIRQRESGGRPILFMRPSARRALQPVSYVLNINVRRPLFSGRVHFLLIYGDVFLFFLSSLALRSLFLGLDRVSFHRTLHREYE